MTDLTDLSPDITPEEFFFEVLPEVLGEVDIPDGLGQERMQFNVHGDEGAEVSIGIDEDGDLTLEPGQCDAPPLAVSTSVDDFRALLAGDLRDRIMEETGGVTIGPKHLRHAFLPDSKVQRIKALSGDIQIRIVDKDAGNTYVVTTTLGGGAPQLESPACTITLDVPTLLDAATGKEQPQQLFFQGRMRIDGDMGIVMGLMSAVSAP